MLQLPDRFDLGEGTRRINGLQFKAVRKVTLPGRRSFAGLGLGQGGGDGNLEALTVQALEFHVSN
jgi:hypothetical protein